MGRVAIVADSSACLPGELIEANRIAIVPLGLTIGGELYADGSLSNSELFERLTASRGGAQTASASPGAFLEAFARQRDASSTSILCLTLSARYSGTYAAALDAAALAQDRLPGLQVRVVDTGGLAMTHGFAVLGAARAAETGACLDEVADTARRIGEAGQLIGTLDTLRYLVKGGRVPWVLAWAASLLRVKPVLVFEEGSARSIGRPRTWPAASERMLQRLVTGATSGGPLHAAVMHVDAPDRARELACEVQTRFRPAELLVSEFSSVMAAHTGPGFVGLAFYRDD
ncbi:MAG: DegV family protein [Chloroflexota bacterium]|nr:DegV family protein [Chloroflexota bacterium]